MTRDATHRRTQGTDRIVVIESLKGELNTGRVLKKEFLDEWKECRNVQVDYEPIHSREELFTLLEAVADTALSNDESPMLHLEIHGLRDGSGLALSNEEPVTWDEIAGFLEVINYASRNNLVVVMAVCNGAGLQSIMASRRAPFWGLVAPTGEVHRSKMYQGMKAFYRELLKTGDGDAALVALNETAAEDDPSITYTWRSCEGVLRDACRQSLEGFSSNSMRSKVIEEQLTTLMQLPVARNAGLKVSRAVVKAAVKSGPKVAFERFRDHYLMIDDFPSERPRFRLEFEDCIR